MPHGRTCPFQAKKRSLGGIGEFSTNATLNSSYLCSNTMPSFNLLILNERNTKNIASTKKKRYVHFFVCLKPSNQFSFAKPRQQRKQSKINSPPLGLVHEYKTPRFKKVISCYGPNVTPPGFGLASECKAFIIGYLHVLMVSVDTIFFQGIVCYNTNKKICS
jgi:hypothetical protein